MDKKTALEAIKKAKEASKKRNFRQTIELIVNLKGIDTKKQNNQIDFFTTLHWDKGTKTKVCALVGPELTEEAKGACDTVIIQSDFDTYHGKKTELKKLANQHDFFIAQANIMPQVATTFGRVFGPKSKMPNPKAGCVVTPKTNLKLLMEKLSKTVRASTKVNPLIQLPVGNEEMDEDQVADNMVTAFDQIVHHLPAELNNVKSTYIKLTMGVSIKVD